MVRLRCFAFLKVSVRLKKPSLAMVLRMLLISLKFVSLSSGRSRCSEFRVGLKRRE